MFYKRVKIKLSERSLMKIVFGIDFPETRKILHETELLDLILGKFKREHITESQTLSKEIVSQFSRSPIYGLRLGEVLQLNDYRIIVDSNDNVIIYVDNPNDNPAAKTVQEVIFLYESEDFFNGSKMMQNLIGKIDDINKDLETFYDSISQESKLLLKVILKDEYKLDNLKKRNKV